MAKRVFFSFHYQDVIDFRANTIRNHYLTKENQAGYFDASLWESSKLKGVAALKNLINDGLQNTSVTVVLIGSETYKRRWVQYEIMKSIEKGNQLIGIHINSIKCRAGYTKPQGINPFDFLGLQFSTDGHTATPTIKDGYKWTYYKDLGSLSVPHRSLEERGQNVPLSKYFPVYDWVMHNGFQNFPRWIN